MKVELREDKSPEVADNPVSCSSGKDMFYKFCNNHNALNYHLHNTEEGIDVNGSIKSLIQNRSEALAALKKDIDDIKGFIKMLKDWNERTPQGAYYDIKHDGVELKRGHL